MHVITLYPSVSNKEAACTWATDRGEIMLLVTDEGAASHRTSGSAKPSAQVAGRTVPMPSLNSILRLYALL